MNPVLEVKNLNYSYSVGTPFEKHAVCDVSFSLVRNEIVGIIGHTGSGKSTLLQLLNGLLQPSSGTIYFDGEDVWGKKYNRKNLHFRVGLVFQYPEYQLFEETVEKDIAFGPKNMGLTDSEVEMRVSEAMSAAGLSEDLKGSSPFDLSGGQKRRVAIAGVLAMKPEVLILDEPTAGLDPSGSASLLSHIVNYRNSSNSTVVLVSHNMTDIASICDRVLVLSKGSVVSFSDTKQIFSEPDLLKNNQLDVPQITSVFSRLKVAGYPFFDCVLTSAQAVDELKKILEGKHDS